MRFAFIAACLFSAGLAAAQPAPPEPEPEKEGPFSERFVKALEQNLQLTDDQKIKIRKTVEDSRPEIEKGKAEVKAAAEKLKSVHKRLETSIWTTREKIRDTLTLEQKQKFDQMTASMNREMHPRRGGPGGPGFPGPRPGEEPPSGPPERFEPQEPQRPQEPRQPPPQTREHDYQD